MEISQLKYFVHVAKLRSFTVAGQRLNVAQSALSRHVKALEAELGVKLLLRTTHAVTPTEAGLRLVEMSDYILQYLEQMRVSVRATAAEPAGTVDLGLLPAVAYIVTPPLLQRIRTEFPKIRVRVAEGLRGYLRERLLLGQLDLAVLTAGNRTRGLVETAVVDEEMVLTGHPKLLQRFRDPVKLASLSQLPLLSTEGFRDIILTAARAEGITLRFEMEQNSLMALKVMLQQGVGLSILPYTVVHEETRDGRLGIRCIRRPRMVRHVAIVRPEYRPAFHALSIVERILAEELRRMPVSPHRAAASADEAAR